jgi:hypothetical protein
MAKAAAGAYAWQHRCSASTCAAGGEGGSVGGSEISGGHSEVEEVPLPLWNTKVAGLHHAEPPLARFLLSEDSLQQPTTK